MADTATHSWLDDFTAVVGGVSDVLKELQPILGEPQTTVPKQATVDVKTATVAEPNTLPSSSTSPWLLVVGAVVLLYLIG